MSTPADKDTGRQRVIEKIAARFRKHGRERTAAPSAKHPPSFKRLLRRGTAALIWGTYIGFTALAGTSHLTEPLDNMAAQQSRSLTAGEAALARAILGPDFATDDIRMRFHDSAPSHPFNNLDEDERHTTLAYVNAYDQNNVHVINPYYHSRDYSLSNDLGLRGGVFMHEIAHIWQNRTGRQAVSCDTYEFTLTAQSRFEDFCNEQQGEIIRAYAVRFIIPSHPMLEVEGRFHGMFRLIGEDYQAKLNDNDSNLARVVEAAFPHAAAARLRIQTNFNNAAVCANDRARAQPNVSFQVHFNQCAATHIRTINGERLTTEPPVGHVPAGTPVMLPPSLEQAPAQTTQARPARPPQHG